MKHIYKNIIGDFILDHLRITDQVLFKDLNEKTNLAQKYKAQELPDKYLPKVLDIFQDKKYFSHFREMNIKLIKQQLKDSVGDDWLIIQTISNINDLDKVINILVKRLREWYSLYFPEFF